MPEPMTAAPVTLKCRICGGDIVNDYFAGTCRCDNCGNKWDMAEMVPDYREYAGIVEKLKKAQVMLTERNDAAGATQAVLMYKSAAAACTERNGPIAADLLKLCAEGRDRAEEARHLAQGKAYFEKGNFKKALSEFEKISSSKESDVMMERCREEIAAARKRRIPYAVIIGMIMPAILSIYLYERVNLPLGIDIPIFIVGTLLVGFAIYLDNTLSIIAEILSFLFSVPLIIFLILAYVFHVSIHVAAALAVIIPVGIVVVIAVIAERK